MKREEGAEQHQRQHRGAAMDHEEIGGGLLSDFSVGSLFQLIGDEPGRAARKKHRESTIDREAEWRIKPPDRQHRATPG
jgi:hypothetical protein